MDAKIKHLLVASIVAVMASGCSTGAYRGASQGGGTATAGSGGYSSGGSRFGQMMGRQQVSDTGQVRTRGFGQSQRSSAPATCAPCGANTAPKSTYTYKPAPKPAVVARPPAPKPQAQTSQYNQQYYIDRWNRQQQQAKAQQRAPQPKQQNTTNYAGYGSGTGSNTTYYDYSSAGGTANTGSSASTSNKSIYTGSYQQKTYKPYNPTTYSGGSAAATPGTATYANAAGTSNATGASYTVKKGDTVFEIMRQTGVYWKDIISLNNLAPPYNISPGQNLRLK